MQKTSMTYEKALEKLKGIVTEMENGSVPLGKLGDKLKEAQELAEYCKAKLDGVEKNVRDIINNTPEANG